MAPQTFDPGYGFAIAEITLHDGSNEALPESGLTVVVGPNNSGKSTLIREIAKRIGVERVDMPYRSTSQLRVSKVGTIEAVIEDFEQRGWRRRAAGTSGEEFVLKQEGVSKADVVTLTAMESAWNSSGLGVLSKLVAGYYPVRNRLNLIPETPLHNLLSGNPTEPLQFLYADPSVETEFSDLVSHAFGIPICINRYSHRLKLLIGNHPTDLTPPPASRDILAQYSAMRAVVDEGDGIRAFVGLLLQTIPTRHSIVIIDEPELFLHPPQARL